jgi:hypothetical protein
METGFWTVFEGVVNTFSGGALILRFFWGGSGSCCPVRLQVLLEPGFEGAEPWFRSDFREETCSAYRYLTDFDRKKLAILNFMDYHGLLPTETGLFKRKLIINKGCSSKNQQ